jgi:hypothetical protein
MESLVKGTAKRLARIEGADPSILHWDVVVFLFVHFLVLNVLLPDSQ